MKLRDLGEFGLIERIARMLPAPPADVVVGIGDDVAVLRSGGPDYLLATCDVQVENVHFVRSATSPYQLGRKAVAINVSDIAAKGGFPTWALVSLAIPEDVPVDFVDELYRGMGEQIREAGGAIVGGNLSGAVEGITVDVFLVGRVAPEALVLRNGAKEGDLIFVTGTPGDSRAGLELILHPELSVPEESARRVLDRHLTPRPRLREGQELARSGCVHAMVDVSDGLMNDLEHICRAGGVGAEVMASDVPVSEACERTARAARRSGVDWALTGGEDYELLFTAAPEDAPRIREALAAAGGSTQCRPIGRILPAAESIRIVAPDGTKSVHTRHGGGWDHFSNARSS